MSARRRTPPERTGGLVGLNATIVACERCTRLRTYCREVARTRRAAYRDQTYWGRPVPTLGRVDARLWIVGLAPAAHGANRTGRMFTGDRSGDFLFAGLHRAGFASAPISESRADGTRLIDCAISATVRCAPPGNKPSVSEVERCRPYLDAEWDLLRRKRVVLALGGLAYRACVALFRRQGLLTGRVPAFGHGIEARDGTSPVLLASYHVSQQNTFTGRLTPTMLDAIFARARRIIAPAPPAGAD
jgi:uracil-DNA glycosylase family 4